MIKIKKTYKLFINKYLLVKLKKIQEFLFLPTESESFIKESPSSTCRAPFWKLILPLINFSARIGPIILEQDTTRLQRNKEGHDNAENRAGQNVREAVMIVRNPTEYSHPSSDKTRHLYGCLDISEAHQMQARFQVNDSEEHGEPCKA